MLDFHIIIPARFASTRLPRKLLQSLDDKIILQHTYERALEAGATSVTIATDHADIFNAMKSLGASVLMTEAHHPNGTSRLAETVNLLALSNDALIVNLQGDEPLMPKVLLQQVAENLARNTSAAIATLYEPIHSLSDLTNPNIVKVVFNHAEMAMYFSRAAIPMNRDGSLDSPALSQNYFRHIGVYAYRASFLRAYEHLAIAPCEQLEKLEQLRALYYGYQIHVASAKAYCPPGIDTQADLDVAINFLEEGKI